MKKYLILNSLILTTFLVFINTVTAAGITIDFDNQESFSIQIDFRGSNLNDQTKITIPARTTKTVIADHENIMKIKAKNGSNIEFDLRKTQGNTNDNYRILVTLNQQTLRVLDQNLIYIQIKPFRPLE